MIPSTAFSAFYYNRGAQWQKGVAIKYKKHGGESFPDTAGVLDIERGQLASLRPLFWQTDTAVSKTSTAEDIRFTRKGPTLHAIALAWPDSGVVTITSLARGSQLMPLEIGAVELVSGGGPVSIAHEESGLRVTLPRAPAVRPHAVALKITTR